MNKQGDDGMQDSTDSIEEGGGGGGKPPAKQKAPTHKVSGSGTTKKEK